VAADGVVMTVVLITGPSGVGKDSLLGFAKNHFAGDGKIVFTRRYITRPPDENELNYFVDPGAFGLLRDGNFFVSHWRAHGNYYGIAKSEFLPHNGDYLSLVSVSRGAIRDFERLFDRVITLQLTAGYDILRQRLLVRGREDEEAVAERLAGASLPVNAENRIIFDNSEELSKSGRRFAELITALIEGRSI